MKPPTLYFIGHISIDRVQNIWGKRIQLGGAALYSAMGAKVLSKNIRIISSVGKDFNDMNFLYSSFPNSLIRRVNMPSTFFDISYDEKFKASYNEIRLGSGALIKVSDLPAHWLQGNEYIHIAPMHPEKTERLVKRIKKISPKTWISLNSNLQYLNVAKCRKILRSLAEEVDLFIVNDREAVVLSESHSLSSAIHRINSKRLAVTLGELGAIVVEKGQTQMIPALSSLIVTPKDTTGAGDTWCGSLLAAFALTQDWTKSVATACLVSALKCLDWSFDKIKNLQFNEPDELVDYILRLKDGSNQLSLKDFMKT
ncbi:MAG: carbohydrate kinase family protein [Candidatus Bathyarchaeota archaeon]